MRASVHPHLGFHGFVLGLALLGAVLLSPLNAHADEGMTAYENGDYAAAAAAWRDKAYSDPYSAYNLGTLYETGKGVDADYKEAFKWYKEAAQDARGEDKRTLKRQTVLSLTRLVIKNRDHNFYATASMYMSTEAMKTGDPEALRMRGLLLEFLGDYSIEHGIKNADNPLKFSWALLRVAADRGSPYAKAEASRVWSKINDKKGAQRLIKTVRTELQRNGVK